MAETRAKANEQYTVDLTQRGIQESKVPRNP